MQRIEKTALLPQITADWVKKNKTKNWQDLPFAEKQALREQLYSEQNGLCCYCCFAITTSSDNVSIEHLADKHQHRSAQFHYHNLLLGCISSKHCNNAKKSQTITIHPLHEDCDSSIKMDVLSAKLIGKEHREQAEHSIEVLKLNHDYLINRRKTMLRIIEEMIEQDGYDDIYAIQDEPIIKETYLEVFQTSDDYHQLKYILDKIT